MDFVRLRLMARPRLRPSASRPDPRPLATPLPAPARTNKLLDMRRMLLAAGAVGAVGALVAAPVGTGLDTASRIIDRTFVCTNAAHAGVRKIVVNGRRGFREAGEWKWLGSASVTHSGGASVRQRRGSSDQQWTFSMAAGEGAAPEGSLGDNPGIAIRTRQTSSRCSSSSARVRLSTRGLSGGVADYFFDEFECVVPRRVVVRVRGIFNEPRSLQPGTDPGPFRIQQANGPLQEGVVAVRTQTGKPLIVATVSESGKARLFTASGCIPE